MGRRRYSRDQWLGWFSEHRESDLTIGEFCRLKNVSENSFYHWRKKLSGAIANATPVSAVAPSFVPVSVLPCSSIEIDLPCGATVRVPTDRSAVDFVLRSLLELGAES